MGVNVLNINDVLNNLNLKEDVSDIHLTLNKKPILRKNGILLPNEKFPNIMTQNCLKEIVDGILNDRKRKELNKNGEVDLAYTYKNLRLRINVFYDYRSLALAIRLISTKIPSVESLNLPPIIKQLIDKKQGLILVTGPTGSGKSTTLASLIEEINLTKRQHILTLEDPIEYIYEDKLSIIHQREVNENTLSFPHGLRAALRQDPDVILIGELRDLDSIKIALEAADTGHLVFSTLHTNGAPQTIERIIDTFPGNQQEQVRSQLANTIQAVVSQQLLPRKDQPGLIVATGIMLRSNAICNMIRNDKVHQIESAMQNAKRDGMIMYDDYLKGLFEKGKISFDTIKNYANNPIDLIKNM